MKNTAVILMALGLALPAMTLAQDTDQPRPPRRERPAQREGGPGEPADRPAGNRESGPGGAGQRPMMVPPLMAALDTNHDGVIDEDEIKNASESLRKLDKNGDGKLTMDELRPPQDGNRPGAGPQGDRNGPADGQRPPRRDARPPEGQ